MLARGGKRQKPCPALGFQNAEQGLDSSRNALAVITAAVNVVEGMRFYNALNLEASLDHGTAHFLVGISFLLSDFNLP